MLLNAQWTVFAILTPYIIKFQKQKRLRSVLLGLKTFARKVHKSQFDNFLTKVGKIIKTIEIIEIRKIIRNS